MKFPDLKPIVITIKKLLQNHNLNQPYYGGISSYSLVLMASTFLNTCADKSSNSMGKNLREMLNYYGNYFQPKINALNGEKFFFPDLCDDPMTVIDPLNPSNNTTRTAYRIGEI